MNKRKQRWAGCLLFLLLIVGVPGLLIWRELHREHLSSQLLTAIRDIQAIADRSYDGSDDPNGTRLKALKEQTRRDEVNAVRFIDAGADPDVRDFVVVKRPFWDEVKFVLKRILRRPTVSSALPRSALAMAVQIDDTEIVEALLKAGARDVNAEVVFNDGASRYALVNYAAYNGNLEIVTSLCAHGADLSKLDADGEPILQSALDGSGRYVPDAAKKIDVPKSLDQQRRIQIFHLLLAKGVKYEPNSKVGYSLLFTAVLNDFPELGRELLVAGVPPNAKPTWLDYPVDFSPLDAACNNNNLTLVKLLLQYGASTKDAHAESPLLYAQSAEMAKLLLENGADIHAVARRGKRQGENAMDFACIAGKAEVVAFLIAHGFDVNKGDPIYLAAGYGGYDTVRILLQHGAKVGPGSPGADALDLAIEAQQFDSAKLLLRYGASVNPKPTASQAVVDYPLSAAAQQDNLEMAVELIKRGANVNAGNGEALIAACESCDEDLVELLLEHGAEPNVLSYEGKTAIQVARQNADPISDADGIISLLKDYGADR